MGIRTAAIDRRGRIADPTQQRIPGSAGKLIQAAVVAVLALAAFCSCSNDGESGQRSASTTFPTDQLAVDLRAALDDSDPPQALAAALVENEFLPHHEADCAATGLVGALSAEHLKAAITELEGAFPYDEFGRPKNADVFTAISQITICARDEVGGLVTSLGVRDDATNCALEKFESDVDAMTALSLYSYSVGDTYQREADSAAHGALQQAELDSAQDAVQGSALRLLTYQISDCI